jgi:hypothetical protein
VERALNIASWALAALFLMFGAATIWAQLTDCPLRPALPAYHEHFQPTLLAVDSVDAAIAYLPTYYHSPAPGVREQVDAVNSFVQDRFLHGPSYYHPCDNWIASVSRPLWENLAIPVLPDDILKHRHALCSQQAIVAQAMLKRLGIHYASVTFTDPGHFAPAARIGDTWYFFDPDTERQGLTPLSELAKGNKLEIMYPGPLGRGLREAARAGRMHARDVDTFPGPRGAAFDMLTNFFSHFGWALFGSLWLALNLFRAEWRLRGREREIRLRAVPAPPPFPLEPTPDAPPAPSKAA